MDAETGNGASLEHLLLDEVEARPIVAYRLLELLASNGWRIRIERGQRMRIVAEKGSVGLEACDERLGPASVSLFVRATSAPPGRGGRAARLAQGRAGASVLPSEGQRATSRRARTR